MQKQIITITAKRKQIKTYQIKARQGKPFGPTLLQICCANTSC